MQIVCVVIFRRPGVVGLQEPARRNRALRTDGGGFFRLLGFCDRGRAIEKVEVIDEFQSLDRKHRRDIFVIDREEIVAICLLAAKREIGRSAIDDRVRPVEAANHEFMMDLMARSDARHLIEGRRQAALSWLAGDKHASLLAERIKRYACRRIGNAVTEDAFGFCADR